MRKLTVAALGCVLTLAAACATTTLQGRARVECTKTEAGDLADCRIFESSGRADVDSVALQIAQQFRPRTPEFEQVAVGERVRLPIVVQTEN